MKKTFLYSSLICILVLLSGCVDNTEQFNKLWSESYQDANKLISEKNLTEVKFNLDGEYTSNIDEQITTRNDVKYEFYTNDFMRFINVSDGYALTIPSNNVNIDYSISKYRVQFEFNSSVLTVSYETSNPYGNSNNGWQIYLNEWLNRYINNADYLIDNNLQYTRTKSISTDIIDGYEIHNYSILIRDSENIEKPYYDIAIIRQTREYTKFALLVMKSETNQSSLFDEIVASYKRVKQQGTSALHVGKLECSENPNWNDETKRYYQLLNNSETFQFGFFSYSMPNDDSNNYQSQFDKIGYEQARLKEATEYDPDIIPTYTHLGWYDEDHYFPNNMANSFARGNGFDEKAVLQFTLQFTRNNNNVNIYNTTNNYTPMFDILRGEYDQYFDKLANDIKAYGKPVLFRLNNEMNTDWTSYCGLITLLDPDIFQMTWIKLYEAFEKAGVDNCIWIFNPIAVSCPYSSWGEDLCYMPGSKYVQALGITNYEMANDAASAMTFKTAYSTQLYTKNKTTWAEYPWIIPEFACGSGGETTGVLFRNQDKQTTWVNDMFDIVSDRDNNEFFKKVTAAVWFNCNDYDSDGKIVNALYIDKSLTNTLNAFKEGFAKLNKSLK